MMSDELMWIFLNTDKPFDIPTKMANQRDRTLLGPWSETTFAV